jgi:Flp pilus assembly protein TadG
MKTRTPNPCPSMRKPTASVAGALLSRLPGRLPRHVARAARFVARPLAECWASDRGASALEYVVVFPLFFAVFLGTFYYGLVFATQSLMDNAARDAARLLRIGTLTGSSYSSALVTDVCNDLTLASYSLVQNCSTTIQIYVAAANSGSPAGNGFTSLSTATVTNNTMTQTKAAVGSNYDVLLQIGYPMPWNALFASGNAMLISTQAFQTEPY